MGLIGESVYTGTRSGVAATIFRPRSATLTRKSSTKKRRKQSAQDSDGEVHKREDPPESEHVTADQTSELVVSGEQDLDDLDQSLSAARRPASDATVKKATYGLMKVQSRRHTRILLRRLGILIVIAGSLYAVWHFWGDRLPTEQLQERLESISSRLFPGEQPTEP